MRRKATWIIVAALATGLVAAGCGGDDDDGGDTLTKEEFIAQGNEICSTASAELDQAFGSLQDRPGTPEFKAFVSDTLVPNVQGQIDDLRALGIPEGDEDTVNGILDDAEAQLDAIEADPSSIQGDPFADVNGRIAEYGLTACAG